ncbi:MAG: glycosyltransferase family 2 protein [Candidatus Shapirobacteria bacterium]|nr:glycosyltransferase family 2 protein [Candidatus Shapirobacteria bacterium]MDD4410559.1 glycosyltransferase family 2 protein [Candidatus Shapirobacteria bacterium]
MKISVIITNWNGLALIKKNLEQVIKVSPEAEEIIVADDASSDKSIDYIKELQKKYSKLKLIANKNNLGFGKNSNNAILKSKGDLVVILNNDIFPHQDYIKNALKHFSDPNLFGVGFAELGHENWARIFWKNGYLQHEPGIDINKTHITAWLSGGSSIIRKDIFQKLGGFDEVYKPFYSEDLDLGLRAWKSGYTLLWEPKCIVEHRHESTMSKFSKGLLNYVKERNRLLSVWRNITDPQLLFLNKFAIIGRVLSGPNYIKIIRAAKKQIKKSKPPIVFSKITDRELFKLFSDN